VFLFSSSVSEPQLWHTVVWPRRVWVRTTDQVFQELAAEENLFKEID
jgi:hypothetical protein